MAENTTKTEVQEFMVNHADDFDRLSELNSGNELNASAIRANVYEMGEIIYKLKEAYPETKGFGDVMKEKAPFIGDSRRYSAYIKLAGHNQPDDHYFPSATIENWISDNRPTMTSPVRMWDTFWKAHKPAPDTETDNGEVVTVFTEESNQTEYDLFMLKAESFLADFDRLFAGLSPEQRNRVAEIGRHIDHTNKTAHKVINTIIELDKVA